VGRVEGSGGEGAEVGLGDEGLDETGVAMSLVDGAEHEEDRGEADRTRR